MPNDDDKGHMISGSELMRWEQEHPSTVVPGSFRIHFRLDQLKCDVCGEQADCLHFLDAAGGASTGTRW